MSKRILKNRFSGKDRWSNETPARLKQVSWCFRRVLFISLKCHMSPYPTPPPPLPLRVWHSSQWLLGILSSGMPPGSQNLDPTSDQSCYNIVVLLPGWISVWCNVVWRWWTGICHQQCDIWDHRTREECFVSGLRGELKLVWFFSIFKPFTGKGGQSQAYTRFTM